MNQIIFIILLIIIRFPFFSRKIANVAPLDAASPDHPERQGGTAIPTPWFCALPFWPEWICASAPHSQDPFPTDPDVDFGSRARNLDPMMLKTFFLFVMTAVAEIIGCYLPYVWLRKGAHCGFCFRQH